MKKMKMIMIPFLLLIGGLTGCFEPQTTDYFDGKYSADAQTILDVQTINGQIEINTWEANEVSLNAIKKSPFGQEELDLVEINVIESENHIDIEAKYVGDRVTTPSVDMNIKVPNYITVNSVITSNGAIQISGMKGDITAKSSNGAIIIHDVDGYISATTSNGRIEIKDTIGIKDLHSSNQGITAEINDFHDNITISTSNGGITVHLNPLLNVNVDMMTSNGKILTNDLSLNLTLSEEKHKIGILGDGGRKIEISTSNGNINLNKLEN